MVPGRHLNDSTIQTVSSKIGIDNQALQFGALMNTKKRVLLTPYRSALRVCDVAGAPMSACMLHSSNEIDMCMQDKSNATVSSKIGIDDQALQVGALMNTKTRVLLTPYRSALQVCDVAGAPMSACMLPSSNEFDMCMHCFYPACSQTLIGQSRR